MARLHNATGRSTASFDTPRDTDGHRPPEGSSWAWATEEMLSSPAWRAMNLPARRVLDRIILEYLNHNRKENGNLIVTFSDFQRFGIRRASVAKAISDLVALGWIDVISRGGSAIAEFRNPSIYSLTWVSRKDRSPRTNRWKRIQSDHDARRAIMTTGDQARKRKSRAQKRTSKGAVLNPIPDAQV